MRQQANLKDNFYMQKSPKTNDFGGFLVRVAGFEPTASWSRTKRATNCAIPGYSLIIIRNFSSAVKVIFSEINA